MSYGACLKVCCFFSIVIKESMFIAVWCMVSVTDKDTHFVCWLGSQLSVKQLLAGVLHLLPSGGERPNQIQPSHSDHSVWLIFVVSCA